MHENKTEEEEISDGTENADDVEFLSEDEDANPAATIKKLREKLKRCSAERQEYLEGWQRIRADFVNSRKNEEENRKRIGTNVREDVVRDLLPVLDSFAMAFANKEAWEKADKNWRMGVEYIHAQLVAALGGYGLEEFSPLGETFDPESSVAIESVPSDKKEDDHLVLEVIQKGYRMNGKVLRPATVKVGEFKTGDSN
jgi:molecular chaperone GrpE